MTTHEVIKLAWAHIHNKTLEGATLAEFRTCRQAPPVRAAQERLDAVAGTGDVLGTQTACQRWNRAWRDALQQLRRERTGA